MIVQIAPGLHRTGCKGPNPRRHSPPILPRSAEVGINAITSYKEHLPPPHESIRRPSQWVLPKQWVLHAQVIPFTLAKQAPPRIAHLQLKLQRVHLWAVGCCLGELYRGFKHGAEPEQLNDFLPWSLKSFLVSQWGLPAQTEWTMWSKRCLWTHWLWRSRTWWRGLCQCRTQKERERERDGERRERHDGEE